MLDDIITVGTHVVKHTCTDGTSARRLASGLRRVFDIFLSYMRQPDYVAQGVGDGSGQKITIEVIMVQCSWIFSCVCSSFCLSLGMPRTCV